MLENVDTDYQNNLRSIYNVIIEDELDSPLFKAIKVPGTQEPEATVPDRTTENLDTDIDQGG